VSEKMDVIERKPNKIPNVRETKTGQSGKGQGRILFQRRF
jgi:hypothetical protein